MYDQTFAAGQRYLAEQGLNRYAVLDCATLPDDIRSPMNESLVLDDYQRLVVLGNSGQQLWQAIQADGVADIDPIDTFSEKITRLYCQQFLPEAQCELVFPSSHQIPLQRIGALLGWGQVSPLGIGISEEYGLWFAYRSAFLTTAELPVTELQVPILACDSCVDKPCISHCPANAVEADTPFSIPRCVDYRVQEKSLCHDRCLARMTCPVGKQHQYPLEMVQYIYRTSLDSVRRYRDSLTE